jgi:hypothetical protein
MTYSIWPGCTKGKHFFTRSGKTEIFTSEMEQKLAAVGYRAAPIFYTHPEATGRNATIEYPRNS